MRTDVSVNMSNMEDLTNCFIKAHIAIMSAVFYINNKNKKWLKLVISQKQ